MTRAFLFLTALTVCFAACRDGGRDADSDVLVANTPKQTVQTVANTPRQAVVDTGEAGGEVAADSIPSPTAARWIDDANVLALLGVLNGRAVAGADAELRAWHSDTVRAFAASVARDHAELQHSADSLASHIRITPIAPAIAESVTVKMQGPIDSLSALQGPALDRAFVQQQVTNGQYMAGLIQQLAGAAQRPEIQALLSSAEGMVQSEVGRARALQVATVRADSIRADSLAARMPQRRR